MFTNSQLEILDGILTRRQDPNVTEEQYGELSSIVSGRIRSNQRLKESVQRARANAVTAPIVPDPFNDPSNW